MRIALLLPTLEIGGVERVFAHLSNGLRQCDVEVDLVVGRAGGAIGAEIEKDVRIIDLGADRMMRSVPKLASYLRSRQPEALIAGMTHSTAAAIFARALAQQKTTIIATEHNTMSKIVANSRGLKYRMMPHWARWIVGRADVIVAVSSGVADDFAAQTGISRERIRVVYNPVIQNSLYAAAEADIAHPWFRSEEPPVILSVGRLDPQKDFPTLLRAFRLVRNWRPARLLILGEGPDRTRIEQTIRELGLDDDVSLPGTEPNPYPLMKRAAAFASSSRWEGFGVALVEALALGASVVATDCPHGPAEILCDGKYGALVPVGDHEAMAQALLTALNQTVLDQTAHGDLSAHLEQFTVRQSAQNYLALVRPEPKSGVETRLV